MKNIEVLDCTLRDGAYIVKGKFKEKSIRGIIEKIQNSGIDIIECGWLKNDEYEIGSTYYHVPNDLLPYIKKNNSTQQLVAMIDYNRYDTDLLPEYDGKTIDAVRVVFPKGKAKEGIEVAGNIRKKGYNVYFQAANTAGYSDEELIDLTMAINEFEPESLSVVDTFGTMYPSDLDRILTIINHNLHKGIKLGFHSHNNQQLSFALAIHFIQWGLLHLDRAIIIDSSLCGMGRGAGNTCSELLVNYLNRYLHKKYNLDELTDCIDLYMKEYLRDFEWGYSTEYALAGMYGCHVNNVSYLIDTHRVKSSDLKKIFETLKPDKRVQYDYENLEKIYMECTNKHIDDFKVYEQLRKLLEGKDIVLILPGKSAELEKENIQDFASRHRAVLIGVNSVLQGYNYNMLFFSNNNKYEYYKDDIKKLNNVRKIFTSNIVYDSLNELDYVLNYDKLIKGEWKYRDNSAIFMLRLLDKVGVPVINIAGFDGYNYIENNYAETALKPEISNNNEYAVMNNEIEEMLKDFFSYYNGKINFLTNSSYKYIFD